MPAMQQTKLEHVITNNIGLVMDDPKNMPKMERAWDAYIAQFTPEELFAMKEKTRLQLTRARQSIESLFNRAMSSMG